MPVILPYCNCSTPTENHHEHNDRNRNGNAVEFRINPNERSRLEVYGFSDNFSSSPAANLFYESNSAAVVVPPPPGPVSTNQEHAAVSPTNQLLQAVVEQNRTLGDTVRALTDQMQVLAVTNRQLVEYMSDMRKDNLEMVKSLTTTLAQVSLNTPTQFNKNEVAQSTTTQSTTTQSTTSHKNEVSQSTTTPLSKSETPFQGFAGAGESLFSTVPKRVSYVSESHDDADASGGHEEHFEPTIEFKPLVPLPALIEVKTGEEDEEVLFKERSKLFRFDNESKEFKERGLGDLKILRHKTSGRVRILMRRDQVLKLCANHYLATDMKLVPMAKSEQAFTWQCQDFSDGDMKCETLAAKFKTVDLAKKFKTIFEECISKLPSATVQKVFENKTTIDAKPTDTKTEVPKKATLDFGDLFKPAPGSWSCSTCFVRNEAGKSICAACSTSKDGASPATGSSVTFAVSAPKQQPDKPDSSSQLSKFTFGFGASVFGSLSSGVPQPTFAQVAQSTTTQTSKDVEPFKGFAGAGQSLFSTLPKRESNVSESHDDADGGHDEHFEPTIEFKPLVPLPALIEVKTGEEDEEILFKERAKLFRFDNETKEFKERGLGELKILRHKKAGRVRILMRRDQVLKLCANHYLATNMKLLPMAKSEQAFTWQCQDFSDGDMKCETLAVKFKTVDLAKKFKAIFEECVSKLSPVTVEKVSETKITSDDKQKVETSSKEAPGFGTLFKPAPGSWSCSNCFVRNDAGKSICVACNSSKDGTSPATGSSFTSAFSTPKQLPDNKPASLIQSPKFSFGLGGNVFGSLASSNVPQPTFAQVAQSTTTQLSTGAEPFKGFAGAGQPLFSTLPKRVSNVSESHDDADASGSHDEHFEPTIEFKPLVPLPALIEVKTGEEDEEILFKERAKLYRFDNETKEFKERGLGELKILRHKKAGRVRILMRRDQVLKLCANHHLAADMKLLPMAKSKQAFTWQCQDFSDGEMKCETLAAKFKTVDLAEKFKTVFEECVSKLATATDQNGLESKTISGVKPADIGSEVPVKATLDFGDLFKPAPGSWSCSTCFVRNDAGKSICAACNTSKDGGSSPATGTTVASAFSTPKQLIDKTPSSSQSSNFSFGFGGNVFGNTASPAFAQVAAMPTDEKSKKNHAFGSQIEKSSQDSELQVTYEAQASPEQKSLAEKFHLPSNFYLYESKVACPGCIGCKTDEDLDVIFKQIDRRTSSGFSGSLAGEENGDDASSEEGKILFCKNATLATKENNIWKPLGVGEILIVYDDDVDAYRCRFHNVDSAALLMNHLIAQPCNLMTSAGKKGHFMAEWTAPDWASTPSASTNRTFQLKFSSALALKEFADLFNQGLEIARKNAIFYETSSDFAFHAAVSNGDKQSLVCEGLLKKMESYVPSKATDRDERTEE